MRKTRTRKEPNFAAASVIERDEPAAFLSSRKDFVAAAILLAAACGIAGNALFLQKGPHPYPIFRASPKPVTAQPAPAAATPATDPAPVAMPRPRPADIGPVVQPAAPAPITQAAPVPPLPVGRSQTDIVIDIQKELGKRGFYEGVADGVYGAKTDTAIRDFEQAAGLKPTREPNEAFLAALTQSKVKAGAAPKADPKSADQIAELIAPKSKVTAVQRALAEYGFGQLKATGILDAETQDAIQQFERARKLPVSGQISPRLVRELSTLTGRPLE